MSGLEVRNVSNLYGVQFTIRFDPTILQVMDTDSDTPGVQIQIPKGTYFEGRDHFIANNEVDNAQGIIRVAVSLYAPATPINGNAVLGFIIWKYVGTGVSNVSWGNKVETKLVDSNGANIDYTPKDTTLGCPAPPSYTGKVLLQGRANYKDTLVILAMEPCLPSFPNNLRIQSSAQNIIPDMPYAFTNTSGEFSITPYTQQEGNYRCLLVFQHGYLTGQKDIPRGGATNRYAGEITLLGGDVNEDDVINIFDLVKISYHMGAGRYNSVADINSDGRVDISDLTIAANNFGLRGPQSNWQNSGF